MPKTSSSKKTSYKSSEVVDRCQVCGSKNLQSIFFLGYLPPVNQMPGIGQRPKEQPAYPAEVLRCQVCSLVQLGLIVDPKILFPPEYPYTSGTTKILRENFAELAQEAQGIIPLKKDDLVIDIGSNDGTLLSNFLAAGFRVLGIEPTDKAQLAIQRGVPSVNSFFDFDVAQKVKKKYGQAKVVTAANVFAHIREIHGVVKGIISLLSKGGVFISESHYLLSLVQTLQYDTIYHEHLRHYSVKSLDFLLEKHGLEIFHVKKIPTHGGSIRVYAARKGDYPVRTSVQDLLNEEQDWGLDSGELHGFKDKVVQSKLALHALLNNIKGEGKRVYGIGAPSRASTLVNYIGLDAGILDYVLETPGSYKIGKYMPGTMIPVADESILYKDQPDFALLLSWHIADELIPKIRAKGFKGQFIVPLPTPVIR